MNSSISNSEAARAWRRFCRRLAVSALVLGGAIYAFIAVVDPFDTLTLSPPFDRSPVATNARYAFPALARKARFDSAILGTSTSRLLRPAELDPLFDADFVNLAMNSATAYEQWRVGLVFANAHPRAKYLLVGLDLVWCETADTYRQLTPRSFPEWMYDDNPWNDYLEQFNLYAVEQAGIQLATLARWKPERYGRDGYTNFLPDDRDYDPARARTHLYPPAAAVSSAAPPLGAAERRNLVFPALPMLENLLAAMPGAEKLVYFVPYHIAEQPRAGTRLASEWEECKRRVAAIAAAAPRTRLVDFMIPSPITRRDENYWDPLHYRVAIADWLMRALRAALAGPPRTEEGYVVY